MTGLPIVIASGIAISCYKYCYKWTGLYSHFKAKRGASGAAQRHGHWFTSHSKFHFNAALAISNKRGFVCFCITFHCILPGNKKKSKETYPQRDSGRSSCRTVPLFPCRKEKIKHIHNGRHLESNKTLVPTRRQEHISQICTLECTTKKKRREGVSTPPGQADQHKKLHARQALSRNRQR